MNFESFSRSSIVFVVVVAMSLSVSPVAWAIEPGPGELQETGFNSYNGPYKDPARMVNPSPTPTPELLPEPYVETGNNDINQNTRAFDKDDPE